MGDTIYWAVWTPEMAEAVERLRARRGDEESSESGEEPEEGEKLLEGRRGNKISIPLLDALMQAYLPKVV